jgi:hypothetical protein
MGAATASKLVKVKSFSFMNKAGGSGMSNWNFDKNFPEPSATVKVVSGFYDYECGWRFIGEGNDDAVNAYMTEVASETDKRIFFSQYELVSHLDLAALVSIAR